MTITKTLLNPSEMHELMQRFPNIELSYETIPHKKVSTQYNVCVAIPVGMKCYAWFTFDITETVCFILEINKNHKVANIFSIPCNISKERLRNFPILGTVLYGTYIEDKQAFVVEDVCQFKGVPMKNMFFGERLAFLEKMYRKQDIPSDFQIGIYLPSIWWVYKDHDYECMYDIPKQYANKYAVHHIQYRCLSAIAPYLNVYPAKKGFLSNSGTGSGGGSGSGSTPGCNPTDSIPMEIYTPYHGNHTKPQYRLSTIFKVTADLQFDIYRLFAYGRNKSSVYYNVAYIPDYTTSVFMNNLFRKIKENKNLDAIEESDDDEDFENMDIDKYVDLKKYVLMECRFHFKFKKWVPMKVVSHREKVVHISSL
jgi:hypothetical protein